MPFTMPSYNWARHMNRLAGRIINWAHDRTYPVRETYIPRPAGNGDDLRGNRDRAQEALSGGESGHALVPAFASLINAQNGLNQFEDRMGPFQRQNREFGDFRGEEYNGNENYRRFDGGGEAPAGGGGVRRAARRPHESERLTRMEMLDLEDLGEDSSESSESSPLSSARFRGMRPLNILGNDYEGGGPGAPGAPGGGGPSLLGYIPEEDNPIPHRGIVHRVIQRGIGHAKEIKGDLSAMKSMGQVVKHGAEVGSGISKLASKDGRGSTAGNIIGGALGGLVAGLGTYAAYRGLTTPEQRSALRAENNFHNEADLQDRRRRMNQEA